jgi:hypothetical protein
LPFKGEVRTFLRREVRSFSDERGEKFLRREEVRTFYDERGESFPRRER